MIDISEIFFSIQGESVQSGLPFIFIRFATCNLRCTYCDAKYSYNPERRMSIDEILQFLKRFSPIKNILITGGEPLLQNEIYPLIDKLSNDKYKIQIETNGTISLKNIPSFVTKIVDVKTPGSGFGDSFLIENLKYINLKKDQIKFVITGNNDYTWAKNFINTYNLFGDHILFSAAWGIYPYLDLVNNILKDRLNVRFQPQIHKFIWASDKKGV